MARRSKKSKSMFNAFDTPRSSGKKKGGLSSIFGKSNSWKTKKGKGSSSLFGPSKGKGKEKKGKGLFSAFGFGKPRKQHEYMRIGGGSGWVSGISGLFGLDIGSTRMDISDNSYESMKSFLQQHDFSTSNSNDVLYYLMHFDGQEDVRQMLKTAAGHNFNIARNAKWIYSEWERWHSAPYNDIIGSVGLNGKNPGRLEEYMGSVTNKSVPKGIVYYVQDLFFGNKDKKGSGD